MLKNELEILANYVFGQNTGRIVADKRSRSDFSKLVEQSCGRAREAWAAAAFSDVTDEALHRYFNFHFNFLSGLIAEKAQINGVDGLDELFKLMDHLLSFFKKFIDPRQLVANQYVNYKICSLQPKYQQFVNQLSLLNSDKEFNLCLRESFSPIYEPPIAEHIELGALFYREGLIVELAGKRNKPELMTNESIISTLIAFNFNHVRFLGYLRRKAVDGLSQIKKSEYLEYLAVLGSEFPVTDLIDNGCFDSKCPHISVIYRDWLKDYRVLLTLSLQPEKESNLIDKVPLNISVKQLACMIRALYQSDFYGNVRLTAIFDHAAAVFTTKRQEHISAESISNAYYALEQSAVLKASRLFSNAVDFLKPYCFPA